MLPFVMMAYRSSVHESTGKTPNEMMLGRNITLPLHIVTGVPDGEDSPETSTGYVNRLKEHFIKTYALACKRLKRSAEHLKLQYDHRAGKAGLEVGQAVWIFSPTRKQGVYPGFMSAWKGPWVVVKKLDDLLYRVQQGPRSKSQVIHVNRLKPYKEEEEPRWFKETRSS